MYFFCILQLAVGRQTDDATGGLLTTVLNLALKYGPVLFNTFFGADGTEGPSNTDRIEELETKV